MKRALVMLMVCALSLMAMVCKAQTTRTTSVDPEMVKMMIPMLDERCPFSLGDIATINHFRFDDKANMIVIECAADEELGPVDQMIKDKENSKKAAMVAMSLNDNPIFNILAGSGIGMVYEYTGIKSGKKVSIEITCDDMKDFLAHRDEDDSVEQAREMLNEQIKQMRSEMPFTTEEGFEAKDIYIKDNYVVFEMVVGDQPFNMIRLGLAFSDEAPENMVLESYLEGRDPVMMLFFKIMAKSGYGFDLTYIQKSIGERIEVKVDNSKIKQFLRSTVTY